MKAKALLDQLHFGNSVAEFDEALESYFVETQSFRLLADNKGDIVAGDKGTGKTALYRILQRRYKEIGSLKGIEVISGFNPAGSPVFQRLADDNPLQEGEYTTIWKAFVLSLVGNWVLKKHEGKFKGAMAKLDELLTSVGLRDADDAPETIFTRLVDVVRRYLKPKSAQVAMTLSPEGIPVLTPKVEFEDKEAPQKATELVDHHYALGLLNQVLKEEGTQVWVVLDRLDEAFQGFPKTEFPALRALLRTYLDLLEFDSLRLKLFVRKDLFRRLIQGGFVNLTHINAGKIDIVWDDDDLFDLLYRRIRKNEDFLRNAGLMDASRDEIFKAIFPVQVDVGEKRPETWPWILSRIKDGNGIKPPRNLIDLAGKAKEAQMRQEDREPREFVRGEPLISGDSLKRALGALSDQRVEDTLLAEAGENAKWIEKFRDGKSEHNDDSLAKTLGLPPDESRQTTKILLQIGFLEQIGDTYKVPMLYRDGLAITQGKAF